MTAALMPFDYEGQTVRTVTIDSEPWFVLADLCTVLGLTRSASAVAHRLDDGVRQAYPISDSFGRRQTATVVSEAGMYEVVIRSDKPEAADFRRWITGSVLPQIRRTGGYAAQPMTREELLSRAVLEATAAIAEKDERIAELAPKAELADTYLASDGGDRLIGQAAKMHFTIRVKPRGLDLIRRRLAKAGLVSIGAAS